MADAALRQSEELFYASHNWQPFFVEGVKTLAYELWEQSGFRAPDNLVVPLGYGSNVLGAARGFAELIRAGEIDRMPRLFGVQAARCAPLEAAFRAGVEHLVPTEIASTVAEGIATPKPTRVAEVIRAVRDTGGAIVAVDEEEIAQAPSLARRPRTLRRADVGGGRRRPEPPPRLRRDPPRRGHRARPYRLGTQGVGHHRRPPEARRPARQLGVAALAGEEPPTVRCSAPSAGLARAILLWGEASEGGRSPPPS